ncbi:MAG: leucine-rich repeat protein [Lachnospiraceae bacterium]|nr:leucine-rich repeat protein [Lachnospiraceae bacterium]
MNKYIKKCCVWIAFLLLAGQILNLSEFVYATEKDAGGQTESDNIPLFSNIALDGGEEAAGDTSCFEVDSNGQLTRIDVEGYLSAHPDNPNEIVIPDHVTVSSEDIPVVSIGIDPFDNVGSHVIKSVVIPGTVRSVSSGAFHDYSSLEKIDLSNGPSLSPGLSNSDINIENSLPAVLSDNFAIYGYRYTEIEGVKTYTRAYQYCLGAGFSYICKDDEGGMAANYFDVTKDGQLVNVNVSGYVANNSEHPNLIIIPKSVTGPTATIPVNSIAENPFSNYGSKVISSVTIPASVTYICSGAFYQMGDLECVVMQNNNSTQIEDDPSRNPVFPTGNNNFFIYGDMLSKTTEDGLNAYEYAMKYGIEFRASGKYDSQSEEVTLIVERDKVLSKIATEIDGTGSTTNHGITAVRIPGGVEEISSTLFNNDTTLESFAADSSNGTDGVEYGLKKLADGQFKNCTKLQDVSLPSTVYDVRMLPFAGCSSLTDIEVDASNPYCCFESGVLYAPSSSAVNISTVVDAPSTDCNYRIAEMLENSTTISYTVPAELNGKTVDEISDAAFSNNQNLQTFSTTGSHIVEIPENCFRNANSLVNIFLADNVAKVCSGAFQGMQIHNSSQPLFRIFNAYMSYEDGKKEIFDYTISSPADFAYNFRSVTKGDTTYTLCCQGDSSDTNDNLYWKGTVSISEETKTPLSSCSIMYRGDTSDDGSYAIRTYTGSTISWTPGTPTSGDFYVLDKKSNTVLTNGTDYTMNPITNPKDIGTYVFTLTGKGKYEGTLTGTFKIQSEGGGGGGSPVSGNFNVEYTYTGPGFFKWTGSRITPNPVVRSKSNFDIILTEGVDYTLSYGDEDHDNISIGVNTGLVVVKGLGNYSGKVQSDYFSIKKSISENITEGPEDEGKTIDLTISDGTYDNTNTVAAKVTLIDRTTGKQLKNGYDYTVTFSKIRNKKQAVAYITGMGDCYYDSYLSQAFVIVGKDSPEYEDIEEKRFTVSFYNGDVLYDTQTVSGGSVITRPDPDPQKEDCSFKGWSNGNSLWNFTTPVTRNMELDARYIKSVISDGESTYSGKDPEIVPTSDNRIYLVVGQTHTLYGSGFKSSDPKVATVRNSDGRITAKKAGIIEVSDGKEKYQITVIKPYFDRENSKKKMMVGKSLVLELSGIDEDLTEYYPVSWQSSNDRVASVCDGVVTAIAKGEVRIYAYVGGKRIASKISVKDVYSNSAKISSNDVIDINPLSTISLKYDRKIFSPGNASWQGDSDNELLPVTNKRGKIIGYENDNVKIYNTGKVKALREGEIKVTGVDKKQREVKLTIKVKAVSSKKIIYLNKGKTEKLVFKNVNNKKATWLLDGYDVTTNDVLKIDKNGKITGLHEGCSTVTCVYEGIVFTTKVFVEDPELKTDQKLVKIGNKYFLFMKINDIHDINMNNLYQTPVYSSNNQSVAFVDENGIVYARRIGNANISIDLNGKKRNVKVTVMEQ